MPNLLLGLAALLALPEAGEFDKVVGKAHYKYAFFNLYEATLSSATGEFHWDKPFSLSLAYERSLSAEKIANASVVEMARLTDQPKNAFEAYRDDFMTCFRDVEKGDIITGYQIDADTISFTFNEEPKCQITGPSLATLFFSIWLSPDSRFPEKAEELLNKAASPVPLPSLEQIKPALENER